MPDRYNAEIVAGGLLLSESRVIARLLLDEVSGQDLDNLITVENVLQKRSPATAKRKAKLITKRFEQIDNELLRLIVDGTRTTAIQAVLISAIRHSKLIGDFLQRVIKQKWRQFSTQLKPSDWEEFLSQCEQTDPTVSVWYSSTRAKLGQVVRTCLIEAGYLESAKNPVIIPVILAPEIRNYLLRQNDNYTLASMDILS